MKVAPGFTAMTEAQRVRTAFDALSPEDQARFAAEVAAGDPLPLVVAAVLAVAGCTAMQEGA